MGCVKKLCGCSAVLVALFAVVVGLFISGVPAKLGLYRYFDNAVDPKGNVILRGMVPAFHEGVAWGFNHDSIKEGDLKGKTYIVTGANVGLGLWSARFLAAKGGHVVLACRSQSKCDAAASFIKTDVGAPVSVEVILLDLGSLKSVSSFAASFLAKHKSLDSLLLNAGIMLTPFGLTADGIEQQLGVNHFGHFYLTTLLLPALEKTGSPETPSTIVSVSSAAHFQSYPEGVKLSLAAINDEASYDRGMAYGQSKLSNVLFAQELSQRLTAKKSNVLVNVIHPGGVDTGLYRHLYEMIGRVSSTVSQMVESAARPLMKATIWSPKDASLTQLYAAVSPDVIQQRITGKYFHPIAREQPPCRVHATNGTLQSAFWDLSEQILKEKTKGF